MGESREFFDAERDAEDEAARQAELSEVMAAAFASWAGRQGILDRITSDSECADLAMAFMAGWSCADARRKAA